MGSQLTTSRRQFLRLAIAGAAGTALLAACGGAAPAPTAAPAATTAPKPVEAAKPTEAPKPAAEAPKPAATNTPAPVGQQMMPGLKEFGGAAVPKPVAKMEGDLILWHNWGNTQGGGLGMIDLIDEFTKLYPQVKVTNVFDADQQKFLAAIASGNVPDLQKLDAWNLPSLGARGALVALDDYIARDKVDMTQFFDFAVDQTSWAGKVYAITHHPDIRCIFTAQDILKEVGLDPEATPKSWDDLMAWGTKMSKKEGGRYTRFGFVPAWTANPWPTQYMLANGAALISEDGRKATFETDEAVEALDWALKATDEVCGGRDNTVEFQEAFKTAQGSGAYWMFPQNRMGMVHNGNWFWMPITIVNPTMKVKNATFPGGPRQKGKEFVFGGGTMVSIFKGAKHQDLAWEWLKFLGSEEGGYLVQIRTTDVSGHRKAANDPRIVDKNLGRKQILPLFEKANAKAYLKSPIAQQFDTEMTRLGDRVLTKEMPIKQALTEAVKATQKALDDWWASVK